MVQPTEPSSENLTERQKMLRGELYTAFTADLIAERERSKAACDRFNNAGEVTRRRRVELWRDIVCDKRPMPPQAATQEEDDALFEDDPWVEAPIRIDYGCNFKVGEGAFINFNCIALDTCLITIGARTLFGPNVNLYAGSHPLDPAVRRGTKGPEFGKEIHIGEDCWIGGNVTVLPGVTIGNGATVGAGSVVTKDIPAFHVAAGNPARVIRRIETDMDPSQKKE
ncbi:Acetyltransferase, CysE/LacA/LpxA/NodL family [Trichophyton interdigitale]|uniref:Acetyltransferase, CysE/LacA/LpxA/NodL family n=1 Tax=Trichophyton interdigitale TaxID=101480 RepID=A0A9P4YQF9_9EURO|nr:Acetyltransferase, CysE/LacA/LpxA/NodL family [Trichophyton interdigitale]KAF3901238.1 Acetyltransferase, CysE/LacA/LpxA/NodL family [Trichophyton interdigitale]KAG8212120.1 Acetyltransferase, CysE/LacA/LpxA/NodL family [Trichophyton interdigitale]